jgi:hypothetical protein
MRRSIVGAVSAFLAIPAIAGAHGGNDDPNAVHACIRNRSQVVRIVGVSGSCISSPAWKAETPAHWGIQGPPGTNGTNGIDGTSVTFVGYFSDNQNGCPNGGAIFAAGSVNAYVCNGQDAATGETLPDGPCFDNTNRYANCGNGTVTDTVTGLIWLQRADCLANNDWTAANLAAASLKDGDCGLTDKSSPGDWRLPTKNEWSATIARAAALGCTFEKAPSLTNDAGTACFGDGSASSFAGVAPATDGTWVYWSASASETNPSVAWYGHFVGGLVSAHSKVSSSTLVWPVRGGPGR